VSSKPGAGHLGDLDREWGDLFGERLGITAGAARYAIRPHLAGTLMDLQMWIGLAGSVHIYGRRYLTLRGCVVALKSGLVLAADMAPRRGLDVAKPESGARGAAHWSSPLTYRDSKRRIMGS
jgi:hypothetical protein